MKKTFAEFLENEPPMFYAIGQNPKKEKRGGYLRVFKIIEKEEEETPDIDISFVVYGYNLLPDTEYILWEFGEKEKEAILFVDEYDCSLFPFGYVPTTAWLAEVEPLALDNNTAQHKVAPPSKQKCFFQDQKHLTFGDLNDQLFVTKQEYEHVGKLLFDDGSNYEIKRREANYQKAKRLTAKILSLYERLGYVDLCYSLIHNDKILPKQIRALRG